MLKQASSLSAFICCRSFLAHYVTVYINCVCGNNYGTETSNSRSGSRDRKCNKTRCHFLNLQS